MFPANGGALDPAPPSHAAAILAVLRDFHVELLRAVTAAGIDETSSPTTVGALVVALRHTLTLASATEENSAAWFTELRGHLVFVTGGDAAVAQVLLHKLVQFAFGLILQHLEPVRGGLARMTDGTAVVQTTEQVVPVDGEPLVEVPDDLSTLEVTPESADDEEHAAMLTAMRRGWVAAVRRGDAPATLFSAQQSITVALLEAEFDLGAASDLACDAARWATEWITTAADELSEWGVEGLRFAVSETVAIQAMAIAVALKAGRAARVFELLDAFDTLGRLDAQHNPNDREMFHVVSMAALHATAGLPDHPLRRPVLERAADHARRQLGRRHECTRTLRAASRR